MRAITRIISGAGGTGTIIRPDVEGVLTSITVQVPGTSTGTLKVYHGQSTAGRPVFIGNGTEYDNVILAGIADGYQVTFTTFPDLQLTKASVISVEWGYAADAVVTLNLKVSS